MEEQDFNYGIESFYEIDEENGVKRFWKSTDFFTLHEQRRNHDLDKSRSDIFKRKKKFICSMCGQEVGFRGGLGHGKEMRRCHAYHRRGGDETCPYKDKKMLSRKEINAIKFNGQETGEKHEAIKHRIMDILENHYSAEVVQEKRVYIAYRYRQADILATFYDKQLVIEIQMSALGLDIILQRNKHYRDGVGMYILWVIDDFSPQINRQDFYKRGILVDNEYNIFAFDAEAKKATDNDPNGELYLHCFYSIFNHKGEETSDMMDEIIPFSALQFREHNHLVFYKSKEQLIDDAKKKYEAELEKKRVMEERRILEEERLRKETEESQKRQREKRINNIKEYLNDVAYQRINNSTNMPCCIRDFMNYIKYYERNEIIEGVTEFMYDVLHGDIDIFDKEKSDSPDIINIFLKGIENKWLDIDYLATNINLSKLEKIMRCIVKNKEFYNKEDSRRMKLERICLLHSLIYLYQKGAKDDEIIFVGKNWRFIRTLYSLFLGQIIGMHYDNYRGLEKYIEKFFPEFDYIFIQAYDYCLTMGNGRLKNDSILHANISSIRRTPDERNQDMDILVQQLFPKCYTPNVARQV